MFERSLVLGVEVCHSHPVSANGLEIGKPRQAVKRRPLEKKPVPEAFSAPARRWCERAVNRSRTQLERPGPWGGARPGAACRAASPTAHAAVQKERAGPGDKRARRFYKGANLRHLQIGRLT
ncbi:hypothetical protein NHU_00308 [Rhodovulum sulfidophilum]|uniref:Uncharacterized protein n=1 Tax=Rhodovulum sulfidophilum TaxID=35806 RepID=A0A0D6AYF8_RHOSU|nr:hypothetical protein NHU_00308 [Rhodovulum sulfidophilum]